MEATTSDTDGEGLTDFESLSRGDELEYVGPADVGGEFIAPAEKDLPYTFQHVSVGGTLCCTTQFNFPRRLAPEHPANDPDNWTLA